MADLPDVTPDRHDDIDAVAALKDPVRRALFRYVDRASRDVGRDEAAEAAGVPRALAAFHLDKLVEEGLLDTTFRRLNGRAGPGAGRPSKLYRRSQRELSVTLPPREYELAARLLARAMDSGGDPRAVLPGVAREAGRSIGERAAADGRGSRVARVLAELAAHGFEPYRDGDRIYLRNCPFHGLVGDHTELVCGMNLALMEGLVDAAAATRLRARLDPAADRCCVVLGPE
jgi:predicted ArsR family transcriptional regulator